MSLRLRTQSEQGNSYFVTGEKIFINVSLVNEQELKKCQTISVLVQGLEKVEWEESHTETETHGDTTTSRTVWTTYSDRRVLYEIPYLCWRSNGVSETIHPGEHSYDFSINLPTTMSQSSCKQTHGQITFTVYAILAQEEDGVIDSFFKFFGVSKGLKTNATFDFVGKQVNQEILNDPVNNRKVIGSRAKTFLLKSGKMCISAILNKILFFDEETMEVELIVENGTSTTADSVQVIFKEKLEYNAPGSTQKESHVLSDTTAPFAVSGNKRSQSKFKVLVPKGILESTLDPKAILRRTYELIVRIPCGLTPILTSPEIKFDVIIVNQVGCSERSTVKPNLFETPRYLEEEDGFEVVEAEVGYLDDLQIKEDDIKSQSKKKQQTSHTEDQK